jgi:outer membrane protein assembly factor BamB
LSFRFTALVPLVALAALVIGCGQTAPPKGWAAPVALNPGASSSAGGDELLVVIQPQPGQLKAISITAAGASERWTFPADGDKVKLRAIYATPVLDGPRLIVIGYSGDVLALDPTSGRPIIGWGGKVSGKVATDPVLASKTGLLFVATDQGAIHPVNLGSGAIFPSRTTQQLRMFGSGVATGSDVIYGALDRRLLALDESSGEVLWSVESAPLLGDLEAVGDRVIAGTVGGRVTAYNVTDGAERWSFQAGAWVWAAPLAVGDTVYVADLDGVVYALDGATGAERWHTTTPRGDVRGNLVLTGGLLIAASSSGSVFALDPTSGAEQWHVEPSAGRLLASPLVLESGVLFLSDAGTLLRVQPATGAYETLYQRN